jgi:ATP-dependent exoDNAse (exonuclease V) beta subunit
MSKVTGKPELPDARARERALDPGGSYIVTAPAGSGKTELLIRRLLVLLARVEHPEEIVAITFTRKAAAEMRDRVLGAMRAAARNAAPEDEAEAARLDLARAALARDRAGNWGLLEHPARLQVMTFDALCAALTRRLPLLSGFEAMPEVLEDPAPLYREAALEALRAAGSGKPPERQDARRLLEHLDNRAERAVGLLSEMLAHREQWLRHVVPAGADPAGWRDEIEAGWQSETRRVLGAARAVLPDALADDIAACAAYAAERIGRPSALAGIRAFPGSAEGELAAWKDIATLLLTSDDGLRKQVNKNDGFPPGRPGSPEAAAKERMKALLEALAGQREFVEWLALARALPPARFEEGQWAILEALARLLKRAAGLLAVRFGQRGQADFVEIARRANLALGEPDAPTDLALRLDYRIRHLLVDEFQDTSLTQRDLLLRLTAGWEPDDGRTMFCVGDPMQSIYRFREAEVGVFLEVERCGLGDLRLVPLRLSSNFRSDPAIVGWVNRKLAPLFAARADPSLGVVDYTPCAPTCDPAAAAGVFVHALAGADAQREAQVVTRIVRRLLAEESGGSIAILVRQRSVLATLLPALDAARIPYAGVAIRRLGEQSVIDDLMSLTRALAAPADRLAWLAVLRAPWCGLSLADLHALAADDPGAPVCRLLADRNRLAGLSPDGQQRLARVGPILLGAWETRDRDDPVRLLERTWAQLGGPAGLGTEEWESAQAFFELATQHTADAAVDCDGLARALQEQYATPRSGAGTRVQVMTLHKAKGLEFDAVVIPALQAAPGRDRDRLLRWDEPAGGDALLFAPGPEFGGKDPHYAYLTARERERDLLEMRRLIYVGVTRAKRQLHLVGAAAEDGQGGLKLPPAQSMLRELWPSLAGEFTRPEGGVETALPPENGAELLRRLPADWTPAAAPQLARAAPAVDSAEPTIEFSWAGETARTVGVLVHEQLQKFARAGLSSFSPEVVGRQFGYWVRRLAAEGVPAGEREAGARRIVEALTSTLGDPRARWLFAAGRAETRTEYAVTVIRDGRPRIMRMDLTFVDEVGTRWIVDYKTGLHAGGGATEFLDREQARYRAQLEGYAQAMSVLDSRPIRLGLYFPLLQGWREWESEYAGAV